KTLLNGGQFSVDIADKHALDRHGYRALVQQRARLQRAGGIRLVVVDVAQPVKISRRQQACINDMLLPPEFKRQIEKNVRMFLVDSAGNVGDAFVNLVE